MENDARDDLIANFKEICGVEEDDVARDFLERCEWDLEISIQEYLNEKEGQPSVMTRERMENIVNRRQEEMQQAVERRPAQAQRMQNRNQSWLEWAWSLVTLPVRLITSTAWDLVMFFYQNFMIPFRRGAITDPVADVSQFVRDFETKYGTAHPNFYQGSYSMAINDAKRELKYLLVYLHSDLHQNTDRFCRETLIDQRLIDFIRQKDVLFWGCSVGSSEGYRVSLAMRETTYPFLALICQRDNRMVVVVRQEGYCQTEQLLEILTLAINDNDIYLGLARQERQHQQQNQILRQEQEAAYQESVRADREKQRRREEEAREKLEHEMESKRREEAELKKQQEFEEYRQNIRQNLPSEPAQSSIDVVRVSLKYPTGSRLERRFLLDDSLNLLHQVALTHDDCPRNFSIVNNYPRKILRCSIFEDDDRSPIITFREAGFNGAISLLIQDNEA